MAAQRPYRQRRQFLTPTAWELKWKKCGQLESQVQAERLF